MTETTEIELIRPEYEGACTAAVVPALLGRGDRDWLPPAAREARTVVLLVLDGLGWLELQKHRARLPVLASLDGGPITTVVPSTTSTALTSIATGSAPSKHGLVGLHMVDGARTLHVLLWSVTDQEPAPDPETFQPVKPFLGKAVPVITRSQFQRTGFTAAHLRGTRFFGWYTTSTLVERCRRLAAEGEPFVYAYYDGVDHLAHVRGLDDGFYEAELEFTDRLVGELLAALPDDAALVVTADHGQVNLGDEAWVSLGDDVLALVRVHAGDARFRFLHAAEGASEELAAACRERFGDRAWVYRRDEVFAEGLLGPRPDPAVAARVGDVVLAAREPIAFVNPAFPMEVRLKTGHGSMTPAEMLVPLLAARGGAR